MIRFREIFRSESGFTLIELLVVIAVLGILAGIAIPRLTGVTNKARLVEAQQALGSFKTALEMYDVEHGRYPAVDEFDTMANEYIDGYDDTDGDASIGSWEGWAVSYTITDDDVDGDNETDNAGFDVALTQTIGGTTYTATLSHDSNGYSDVETSASN
jgi:general secretion pathway protein G